MCKTMRWLTGITWVVFVSSAVAVGVLVVEERRAARTRPPPQRAATPAPLRELPAGAVGEGSGTGDAGTSPAGEGESSPEDPASANGSEEEAENKAETAPEDFLAGVIESALKRDFAKLLGSVRPGASRSLTPVLLGLLQPQKEARDQIDAQLKSVEFAFDPAPGGALKLRILGPEGAPNNLDLFLVPEDGSWKLADSTDLPGPAADAERASKWLQLLAVCKDTVRAEDLGGGGSRDVETIGELAERLDRSPLHEGILDPEFAAAVDRGIPFEGYVFTQLSGSDRGFGFCATPSPGAYASGARETLLIDQRGQVWTKDLAGEPPPTQWPGTDPAKNGWERKGRPWF